MIWSSFHKLADKKLRFPAGAANALKLKITAAKGGFTGGFEMVDGSGHRKAVLNGMFIPGTSQGFGYFLLPETGASTSAILSGVVEIAVE